MDSAIQSFRVCINQPPIAPSPQFPANNSVDQQTILTMSWLPMITANGDYGIVCDALLANRQFIHALKLIDYC